MKEKYKSLKIYLIAYIALIVMIILSITSFAYFSFKKVYEGGGDLPVLHINYTFASGNDNAMKNIVYNGQQSENVAVNINTNGNNLNGLVRAKIVYSWANSLSNLTYKDGNVVKACSVSYNGSVWEEDNGYLYLIQQMEPDTEIELFSDISFENLPNNYRGNAVSVYLICEICQTNNLPTNWRS